MADMPCVRGGNPQPELHLRGFTYQLRSDLLPELGVAIDHAGGWVLERRTVAANALELVMEVQTTLLPDLYAALVGAGVELTRDSHRSLAQQCTCALHQPARRGPGAILLLCLEMHFLPAQPELPDALRLSLPHCALA